MLRRPFLAITIAFAAAAVGATPVLAEDFGPANETASCVGEFASAGGTQLGSTYGAIRVLEASPDTSGAIGDQHPFGNGSPSTSTRTSHGPIASGAP